MNKIIAAVFAGFTTMAAYTTVSNVGVQDSSFQAYKGPPSVRLGSTRAGLPRFGGGRGGK
jgi:hypothetical protein